MIWHFIQTICMKCQNLFTGKIRKIFQNVICWNIYPECYALKVNNSGCRGFPLTYIHAKLNLRFGPFSLWIFLFSMWGHNGIAYLTIQLTVAVLFHFEIYLYTSIMSYSYRYMVWLNKPQLEKTYMYLLTCAPNEDSDQTAHPRSLIRVFVVRLRKLCILDYPKCTEWRFWSDCANAQAGPKLHWEHISEGTFSDVVDQIWVNWKKLVYISNVSGLKKKPVYIHTADFRAR